MKPSKDDIFIATDVAGHMVLGPVASVRVVGAGPTDSVFSCEFLDLNINISRIEAAIAAKPKKYRLVSLPCDETAIQVLEGYSGIDESYADAMPMDVLRRPGICVNVRGRVMIIDGYHRLSAISRRRLAKWFPCYELTVGQVRHFAVKMFRAEPGTEATGPWTEVPAVTLASSPRTKTQQIENMRGLFGDPEMTF